MGRNGSITKEYPIGSKTILYILIAGAMDWNKPWSEEGPKKGKNGRKWNYVFWESLKMAFFLPLVILSVEIFILDIWQDIEDNPIALLFDYLFLFSIIFLIFVIFHVIVWNRQTKLSRNT